MLNVKEISIDLLQEYENNPRFNDNAVDKVMESIKEFGFKVPIIIDKDNVIIAGHTRYKAAKELGLEKVPCLIADDLTPEQVKAFRLADNKVSEFSSWDQDKLYSELMELQTMDFNIESFGFESSGISTTTTGNELEESDGDINPDSNFNYKEQYGVIVMCKNEAEQEEIYSRLLEEGYECKVVAT